MDILLELLQNLASYPQLLLVALLEGVRIFKKNGNNGTMSLLSNKKDLNGYVVTIILFRSFLNASPSIIICMSIFFVRF